MERPARLQTDTPGDAVAPVRVELLGGLRVAVGPRLIEEGAWHLRKAGALIEILALAPGHRLHREQAMEMLWPDLGPQAAANGLYHALHFARRVLRRGEPASSSSSFYLQLHGEQLSLSPDAPLWVDVDAFRDAAGAARRSRDPAAYRAAIGLYSGELLPGRRYEDWAAGPRAHLRDVYLDLLARLAGLYEARGEYGRGIEALGRVVGDEPTNEAAHATLMRLYALSGRRGRAMEQYGRLRDALSRELVAEPDESSRCLHEAIVGGRFPPTGGQAAGYSPLGDAIAAPHNLPIPRKSFVGREQELVEVGRSLAMTGLLTLTGMGGCGKTRLALEVARDLAGAYPDGIWLVELAPLARPSLLPGAVARVVGACGRPDGALDGVLEDALRTRKALLLLDNCEHLVEAAARLAEVLLASCPRLSILATSREPLGVAGEVIRVVSPLSLPDPRLTTEESDASESVRLFADRASQRSTRFSLTPQNVRAVAEICRKLDGIPLAIELAASMVGVLDPEQIAERLDDCLTLLRGGGAAAPRQQTLHGVLDWSYDLLAARERMLFRRLSVFAGSWMLGAAEAAGAGDEIEEGEVLRLLSRLVDKSLVVVETAHPARYRLLEPVRQYARVRLGRDREAREARRRHALWYLALAEQAEVEVAGPDRTRWLDRLDAEHDNIRAAIDWSLEGGDEELGVRLASALWLFWHTRGHMAEGRARLERGASGRDADSLRARALEGASFIALFQTEYERSRASAAEALVIYRNAGDKDGIASCLCNLVAAAVLEMRDLESASSLYEEARGLRPQIRDPRVVAKLLLIAGLLHAGDPDRQREAVALHEEALALYRAAGDLQGVGMCLADLGLMALGRGDYAGASAILLENLRVSGPAGDMQGIQNGLLGLGGVAASIGRAARATKLWGAAQAVRAATGLRLAPLTLAVTRYEGVLAATRGRLGEPTFAAQWAAGAALTAAEAVAYALSAEPMGEAEPTAAGVARTALTARERGIANLVAQRLTNREIAVRLALSRRTVDTHVHRILKKLALRSREQLTHTAGETGRP